MRNSYQQHPLLINEFITIFLNFLNISDLVNL